MHNEIITIFLPFWFRKNNSDQVAVIGVTWSRKGVDTPVKYKVWHLPEKLRDYGEWTPYVLVNEYEIVGVRI